MDDLARLIRFTAGGDRASSSSGWVVPPGVTVDSLAGDDRITGAANATGTGIEIFITSTLNTSSGNDAIKGIGGADDGYGIRNKGTINTGITNGSEADNDSIEGIGVAGIINYGTINTGNGADTILGRGTGGFGIINSGMINTGDGDDVITGTTETPSSDGISGGTINTGAGSDRVTGNGTSRGIGGGSIDTGSGNDNISGSCTDGSGISIFRMLNTGNGDDIITGIGPRNGIEAIGDIDTGADNDTITGAATRSGSDRYGIYLDSLSTIRTGSGADVVDAMNGGFAGGGRVDLGSGDDTLKGFGRGNFQGGDGIKDTLVFRRGAYTIRDAGLGSYLINDVMRVSGFELFGPGASILSFAAAARAGSVTFA